MSPEAAMASEVSGNVCFITALLYCSHLWKGCVSSHFRFRTDDQENLTLSHGINVCFFLEWWKLKDFIWFLIPFRTQYLPIAGISPTDPWISQTDDERSAREARMSASVIKIGNPLISFKSYIFMKNQLHVVPNSIFVNICFIATQCREILPEFSIYKKSERVQSC